MSTNRQRKMTARAAQTEAVRRWGKDAATQRAVCSTIKSKKDGTDVCIWHGSNSGCAGGRPLFKVGKVEMGMFFHVYGSGDSWEDAFAAAEAHFAPTPKAVRS